jgi:hypothetical protein
MKPAHRGLAPFLLAGLLVLAGCAAGGGARTPTAEPSGAGSGSTTPADSAAPSADGSASPTTADTATPTGSPTPGSTPVGTEGATPGGTPPSATVAASSCPTVNPIRVNRAETGPRRATEVVAVISDGTNLTSGTREQTDFLTPALTAPDGTTITDEATFAKIATLVAGQRHRVLLTRPEPPDATASTSRKPFSSPGTYVVYNASSQLIADVVVQCSGAELIWTFVSEADPSSGQVNCAVEPPRTNALARVLFQNNC